MLQGDWRKRQLAGKTTISPKDAQNFVQDGMGGRPKQLLGAPPKDFFFCFVCLGNANKPTSRLVLRMCKLFRMWLKYGLSSATLANARPSTNPAGVCCAVGNANEMQSLLLLGFHEFTSCANYFACG
jgi:hypothetical protein